MRNAAKCPPAQNSGRYTAAVNGCFHPSACCAGGRIFGGINAEFFYPKGRYQTHPYKWIVIRISLKNGEIIEGTVLGKEDILAVNDSFDGFIKYGEGKGIAISRKFV